jgi:hypothetical protein
MARVVSWFFVATLTTASAWSNVPELEGSNHHPQPSLAGKPTRSFFFQWATPSWSDR